MDTGTRKGEASELGASPVGITVLLRWSDIDTVGHVNAARYHDFLEEARSLLFESREGGDNDGWVLARIELDHRGELTYADREVEVLLSVIAVRTTSAEVAHEIRTPSGRVVAAGRSVLVAWDQEKRAKREIVEPERTRLLELGN